MHTMNLLGAFIVCWVAFGATPAAAQDAAAPLPTGVSTEMIAAGDSIFGGPGVCYVCHGSDAKGMPGLGANLTDSEWIHSDGSWEGIITTITDGARSKDGVAMPPKGGATLSEEEVKEVAAYVWSLSHTKKN